MQYAVQKYILYVNSESDSEVFKKKTSSKSFNSDQKRVDALRYLQWV